MKHLKLLTLCGFLIGISFSFSIVACGGKDDKAKPKDESYATAHVTIGNGIAFDFKSDHTTGISAMSTFFTLGFGDFDNKFQIQLQIFKPQNIGLQVGTYTLSIKEATGAGKGASSVVLLPLNNEQIPESFDTKANIDDDFWNDGTGSITITSINGNWIEGTFNAVAYSKSGNEARITDGKFKVKVDIEF